MTDKIFKAFPVVSKAIDLEKGIFEAMISTEAVDRQGDIVRATGARLENFLKNPVVLWAHDYSQPPVAKALSIEILAGMGLKSVFQFPEWELYPQADVVRRLWAAGFLNATSIGFIPIKSKAIDEDDEDIWWGPRDYVEWEMLEYSIVPVPANQEALRLAVKSLAAKALIEKRGRVLSAGNEKKLKEAAELINGVLSQLGTEEEDSDKSIPGANASDTEHTAESNTTPTSNDANEALLKQIDILLNTVFEVKP